MRVVEALLVLSMTTFHLSVVPGRIGADELVPYAKLSGRCLKESFQVTLAAGETIGELKSVIGLDLSLIHI